MKNAYEKGRAKRCFCNLYLLIAAVQLVSLLFFAIVGKFEAADEDYVLKSIRGITSLSSTITVLIMTIYAVVILNKSFLICYIGAFRERTYAFPAGRDDMFKGKLRAYLCKFISEIFAVIFIMDVIYCCLFGMPFDFSSLISDFAYVFALVLLEVLSSAAMLICSLLLGLKFQSTNASLITAIVLAATLGNLLANSYILGAAVLIMASAVIFIFDYAVIRCMAKFVREDDVMQK